MLVFNRVNSNPSSKGYPESSNQSLVSTPLNVFSAFMFSNDPFELQTRHGTQTVRGRAPSADPRLPACASEGPRERKVFLIASRVRGPGSSIAHDQVRVAFRELLAGYLSQLSIPLLGLGLSVGMIRSWRQGW